MSDCEQIRLYIQQQFDADLPFEDERAVVAHLDSCDSCTRYRSQIEQVVVFAQDLPLSEELLPAQYERLVGRVAEHLPKPTLSGFDMVVHFFGKVLGLRPKGTSIVKPLDQNSRISFPHMSSASHPQQEQIHQPAAKIQTEPTRAPAPLPMPISIPMPSAPMPATPPVLQPTPSPMPQPAAEATVTKIESIPQGPEPPKVVTAPSTELVPPASILTRLANVLEGNEITAPLPAQAASPAETRQVSGASPIMPGTSSSTSMPRVLVPASPLPVPATSVSPPPVAMPPVTASPVSPAPVAPPPVSAPASLPPPPPPAAQSPPVYSDNSDLRDAGLLKGIDDTDIENIFTQTLGVSQEAARATVRKPSQKPAAKSVASAEVAPPEHIAPAQQPTSETQAEVKEPANTRKTNAPKASSLFLLDDETMDKIFAENLGIEESGGETTPEKITLEEAITMTSPPLPSSEVETSVPAQPMSSVEAEPLASTETSTTVEASETIETHETIAASAETKISVPPPASEVEGLGRLDAHSEAAVDGPSQIGAIGKFLLDKQDIQNLEKLAQSNLAETGLRVLTPSAAQDLQTLLQRIHGVNGVVGSVIVGHDGIVVSTDLPDEFDSDSIAVWSLGIYLNTDNAIKKMGRNSVSKVVAQTTKGHLTITDFGAGILATLTNDPSRDSLIGVMNVINELVSTN
jgi:predicted regulator of Ras-like GTPase activity (Roadblock/LC7/MglB family)